MEPSDNVITLRATQNWVTQRTLATELGVTRTTIANLAQRQGWKPVYRDIPAIWGTGERPIQERVFSPEQETIIRGHTFTRRKKNTRRSAPNPSKVTPIELMNQINDKLDRLLRAAGV